MIVVGGGIGGILGAWVFRRLGFDVLLLEAFQRLGGCASTFERNGAYYNAGATTLPGLNPHYPMERLLKILNLYEKIKDEFILLDNVCEVSFEGGKRIKIFSDTERTLEEVSRAFPVKGHKKFFSFIAKTTKELLTTPFDFSLKGGSLSKFKLLLKPMNIRLLPYISLAKKRVLPLLRCFYDELPSGFLDYLRAQTFIVGQIDLEEANALVFTLGVGYNFTGIAYPKRGIGKFLECLAEDLPIEYDFVLKKIRIRGKEYLLHTSQVELATSKLLLAIPFLERLSIFDENEILYKYFRGFSNKLSPYSAFVVYGKIKRKALIDFSAKHQIVITKKDEIPETSGYLHISLLEQESTKDFATFTISTHTPLAYWLSLEQESAKIAKRDLESRITEIFLRRFELNRNDIEEVFSATPFTFKRYLGRLSLGGFSSSLSTPFWSIPNNFTPFRGLYLACDHAFAGQGFMGISLGCLNLFYGLS